MRDPHVVALTYKFLTQPVVKYENPPPLEWDTDAFHLRLEGERARLEMKEHYPSVREARDSIEPFLRAWEIRAALQRGDPEMQFEFEAPEVIDRSPPMPGEPQVIRPEGIASVAAVGNPTVTVTEAKYPEPPRDFALSLEAETLWLRYARYREGRETLPSMAYACHTFLEMIAGGKPDARFGISDKVLGKLGELTSERGDRLTARKFTPRLRPYTPAETKWLETAIRKIILKVGEVTADSKAPIRPLTMADLPHLPGGTGGASGG